MATLEENENWTPDDMNDEEEDRQEEGKNTRKRKRSAEEYIFEAMTLAPCAKRNFSKNRKGKKGEKNMKEENASTPPRGMSSGQILQYLHLRYPQLQPEAWLDSTLEKLSNAKRITNENEDLQNMKPFYKLTPSTFQSIVDACSSAVHGSPGGGPTDLISTAAVAFGAQTKPVVRNKGLARRKTANNNKKNKNKKLNKASGQYQLKQANKKFGKVKRQIRNLARIKHKMLQKKAAKKKR